MSQAKALMRCPVHCEPLDPVLLARTLRRLARRATRFSPRVTPDAPDGMLIDATGCEHLFGGAPAMIRRVAEYFEKRGLTTRVGAAPCFGAAWALARFGANLTWINDVGEIPKTLAPLPIAALRFTPEQQAMLESVGIETVGQAFKLPRAELASRLGPDAPRRIDQVLGKEKESITPVVTRPPVSVSRMFAGPTDRTESIALCVRQLLVALCRELEHKDAGCRELCVTLLRSDLAPVEIVARSSTPTRDSRHWYTLMLPQLERAHLGFGIEGVAMTAQGVRTLKFEQSSRWLDHTPAIGDDELCRLADTLASRLGNGRVLRMRTRASHIPERSCVLEPVEAAAQVQNLGGEEPPLLERPSLLLEQPVPIDTVFLFPEGPIGSVTAFGETWRVLRCIGPERISAEWWRREHLTRDYYRLHTENGAWLWVFRVVENGRWFLHGEWA